MSEPDIYTIKLADNEPEQFVKHTDYMKLHCSWKEMFADGIQVLRQERYEMAKLKDENNRLTENIEKLCKHGDLEIERLKAKVERLTKAGIAMGMALPDTDEANAAYSTFERVVRS